MYSTHVWDDIRIWESLWSSICNFLLKAEYFDIFDMTVLGAGVWECVQTVDEGNFTGHGLWTGHFLSISSISSRRQGTRHFLSKSSNIPSISSLLLKAVSQQGRHYVLSSAYTTPLAYIQKNKWKTILRVRGFDRLCWPRGQLGPNFYA